MKSDGSVDQKDLKAMFAEAGMAVSPSVEKFNELDTNKNGKIEQSEVNPPQTIGEDKDPDTDTLHYEDNELPDISKSNGTN